MSRMSSPATGSAEWPPDDRLRRVTLYSRGRSDRTESRGVLDPRLRGTTFAAAGEPSADTICLFENQMMVCSRIIFLFTRRD